MCNTLTCLELDWEVDLRVPKSVSLPNLKVLHLEGLRLVNGDSIQKLIRGCPLLQEPAMD